MRSVELLAIQFKGINNLYHSIADDLSEYEWMARTIPCANVLGFTLWHLPRSQDWAVQTLIRGVPEVILDGRWQGKGRLQTPGIGVNLALAEADELAGNLSRNDVLAYADAVHHSIVDWLSTIRDDDLDTIPDMLAHEAPYPEYQTPAWKADEADLVGLPVWRFLLGPAMGHLRHHLGELEIIKQALRAN